MRPIKACRHPRCNCAVSFDDPQSVTNGVLHISVHPGNGVAGAAVAAGVSSGLNGATICGTWRALLLPGVAPQTRPHQVGDRVRAAVEAGHVVAERSDPATDKGPGDGMAGWGRGPILDGERAAMGGRWAHRL